VGLTERSTPTSSTVHEPRDTDRAGRFDRSLPRVPRRARAAPSCGEGAHPDQGPWNSSSRRRWGPMDTSSSTCQGTGDVQMACPSASSSNTSCSSSPLRAEPRKVRGVRVAGHGSTRVPQGGRRGGEHDSVSYAPKASDTSSWDRAGHAGRRDRARWGPVSARARGLPRWRHRRPVGSARRTVRRGRRSTRGQAVVRSSISPIERPGAQMARISSSPAQLARSQRLRRQPGAAGPKPENLGFLSGLEINEVGVHLPAAAAWGTAIIHRVVAVDQVGDRHGPRFLAFAGSAAPPTLASWDHVLVDRALGSRSRPRDERSGSPGLRNRSSVSEVRPMSPPWTGLTSSTIPSQHRVT